MIGLTATPNILRESEAWHGFPIRQVLDESLTLYRADHLWIMGEAELVSMLRNGTLQGKTINMGDSRDRTAKMAAEVPNSEVLISQHASGYTQQMEHVRETIVEHGALPEDKAVLFATTTMQEGVQWFYDYIDSRWAVDDVDHVPEARYIWQKNQPELIKQSALHGVFDEMRYAR